MSMGARMDLRVVTSAAEIGFTAPPVALRVKLVVGPSYCSLFAQPLVPIEDAGIAAWVETFGPSRIEFGERSVLRADFERMPSAWRAAFRGVEVDMIRIEPDGQALVRVRGVRSDVTHFARRTSAAVANPDVRHVGVSELVAPLLTPSQDAALRAAVESGYYLIPRPLNLRQLAERMRTSSASLSERLRRAEGRVLTRYVREGGRSPWDDETIYDARPLLHPNAFAHEAEGGALP